MDSCFKCGGRTVKNGSVKGRPKRKCVACGFQSVGADHRGQSKEVRHFGVLLYSHGLSLNAVGKRLGVSATAVMKGVKRAAQGHGAKPALAGR
jgi:transposase-like protein